MSVSQVEIWKHYSIGEEIANSITHGIGALLSMAGLVVLIMMGSIYGNSLHVVCFSVYGTSLILLYLASTLYHSLPGRTVKQIFKKLDHSAIFLLIAGSYTPLMLINIKGVLGWSITITVWVLAVIGVVIKCLYIKKFEKVSLCIYIFMGWLCIFAAKEIFLNISPQSLIFLVIGGLLYSVGTIFYVWEKLPYNHGIWHVFVLGGSIFHYFSILTSFNDHAFGSLSQLG
ncbi:MAG: hemolysin III family protein [Candidatus Magnetomorum sp.]|nr:hemolysin III family protein [Candidatus Magnetomorum sp.]